MQCRAASANARAACTPSFRDGNGPKEDAPVRADHNTSRTRTLEKSCSSPAVSPMLTGQAPEGSEVASPDAKRGNAIFKMRASDLGSVPECVGEVIS
jgi:hypothetical protein